MNNPGLIKTFVAVAAIAAYRIVKFGATDNEAAQAAAATDVMLGVTSLVTSEAIGERVDITMSGVVEVEFGGTIARGGPVTADASGRAVAAVIGNNVLGYAAVSGVIGDIGSVIIDRSKMS